MFSLTTTALLSFLFLSSRSLASPCVVFDIDFNLYVFGLGGKDFSLGPQSGWSSSGTATDITATGRPPFDGTGTTCFLAQFFNAIYVMNGDKSNPTDIGIYDVAAKSWTTQKTSTSNTGGAAFDITNYVSILDHDTNVFFALSGGNLFSLPFGTEKSANATAISWGAVGTPSFSTSGYNPVMALAQNHIHFLDVPGSQPGTAQIFVIHFSFFQPDAQSYPAPNGANFPVSHGQATSFFQPTAGGQVQQEFAFIPDDNSQTYVVNVETNTTAVLAGPTDKSSSTFTAGVTSLVQLTSAGNVFFLPYKEGDASTNSAAAWSQIKFSGLPAASSTPNSSSSPSASGGASGSGSGSGVSGSGGNGGSPSPTGTGSTPAKTGGASSAFAFFENTVWYLVAVGMLAAFAV